MLRYCLLTIGLLVLGLLVWHIGPGKIYDAASTLGPVTLLLILIPSLLMYAIEAYGWKVVLGQASKGVAFWRLLTIRTAGEVVNITTPTAFVGGEPLKVYLLNKHHQVPISDGGASVVIAKTTMTIAEVVYILAGVAIGFWLLGSGASAGQTITAALLSIGLLVCSIVGFVFIQHRGLFASILSLIKKVGLRIKALEAQEEHLRSIDQTILNFYRHHQRTFMASIGVYFLGWLAESLEVFGIIYALGGSISFLAAISIGAFAVFIKGGSFFIPGSLGAQEAGNLLLLQAFGYSDVTGLTFALLRRFRELVWIGIGLFCLAMVGKGAIPQEQPVENPS